MRRSQSAVLVPGAAPAAAPALAAKRAPDAPAARLARRLLQAVVALASVAPALLLLPAPAEAQQADLEVVVRDQASGAPLAAVEVVVTNADIGVRLSGRTNDKGKVRFSALSTAGSYTVAVAETDRTYGASADPIVLRSNSTPSVILALSEKAALSAEISVTTTSSVALLNTTDAEVSSSLRQSEIEELPVEGRDVTRALYRLPGVVQATGFYPEAPNVGINGANSLYTNYLLDGLDNNENFLGGEKFPVPIGFSRGVTVLTGDFSAEYGRSANGIVNVTTRSGANLLRGELYYLTRPGPAIDASTPFDQRDLVGDSVKAGFKRNQGGFDLGGTLRPNRTFYWVDAEYTRDHKENLLNVPELGINTTVPGTNDFTLISGKLDQSWSAALRSSLRVNFGRVGIDNQGGGTDGGVIFPSAGSTQDRDSLHLASNNSYVGRDFISETNLQFSSFRWNYTRANHGPGPQVTVLDPQQQPVAVLNNPAGIFNDLERTWELQQKGIKTFGGHTLKGGAEVVSSEFGLVGGGNVNGNYTVELTQQQLDALRVRNLGAGLSIHDIPADVAVLDYNIELQPRAFGARQNIYSGYLEDLYSANPRLNLTVGLRYDYDSLSKGAASRGNWDNFAPRFNFNYELTDKSTLRGGFGRFYDKIVYSVYSDALQQSSISPGFRSQIEQLIARGLLPANTDLNRIFFDGNVSADYQSGVPYLQGPRPDPSQRGQVISNELRILNPAGYQNPYSNQATLGYQLQVASDTLFYVDGMFSRSYRLFRLRDLNPAAPYPIDPNNVVVRTPAEANATRPVQPVPGGAVAITETEDKGKSHYEALTVNLVKDRGRFAYRFSYTLSRLTNNTEDINFRAQDANNYAAEWGPSINDRTHVINAIVFYHALDSLTVSLAGLFQSGQPINRIPNAALYGTTDLNGDGRSYGAAYDGNSDRQPGEKRNDDRLPWSRDVDFSLQYHPPWLHGVELRADVFNLFNTVNLSGYSNNATQSNQIQIGPRSAGIVEKNAGPPRQYQFGVRYVF